MSTNKTIAISSLILGVSIIIATRMVIDQKDRVEKQKSKERDLQIQHIDSCIESGKQWLFKNVEIVCGRDFSKCNSNDIKWLETTLEERKNDCYRMYK